MTPRPSAALYRQQDAVLDVAALLADRVDHDPYEASLLVEARHLAERIAAGVRLSLREATRLLDLIRQLQAFDHHENGDHIDAHRRQTRIAAALETEITTTRRAA